VDYEWLVNVWSTIAITLAFSATPLNVQFAYALNSGDNNVSGYTIDPTTGPLTPIAGSPFDAGTFPLSVAVDPNGKFVYVANSLGNSVSGYTINPTTGALTPIAGSPSSGKFTFVANFGDNSMRDTRSTRRAERSRPSPIRPFLRDQTRTRWS
jgi:DNA-binding beta-propeller fold protein YncE